MMEQFVVPVALEQELGCLAALSQQGADHD